MIALRLARTELRRLTSGRLPKIALIGVVLVPLLYGGFYLYANWDPYAHLNRVPAALVVADRGTTADGQSLTVGKDVSDELLAKRRFDWHPVSAREADAGVRSGRYTFALTLPSDFSEALASPAVSDSPRQGLLTLTTNDANSYTGSVIGQKVVEEVRRAVAAKVGTAAADRMLVGFATIQEKTQQAADGSTTLAAGAAKAADGAGALAAGGHTLLDGSGRLAAGAATAADGAARLGGGADRLADGLGTLRGATKNLPAQSAQLASGARQVADGNAKVAAAVTPYAQPANDAVAQLHALRATVAAHMADLGMTDEEITTALARMDADLKTVDDVNGKFQSGVKDINALAAGSRRVADGADQLAAGAPRLSGGIATAADGATRLATGAGQLAKGTAALRTGSTALHDGLAKAATGADALSDGTRKVADGSHTLADGLADAAGRIPHPDDPTRATTARVLGDPVAVRNVGMASAESYGAGLAPFFLGLALWVGAFTLFMLVRPLSRRALAAGQRAWRVALGGWLPSAALGSAQVLLLFAFAVAVIGVAPARPVATLAFMLLTGWAFTAIVHGLNALLGPAGKFVALVLLVLQLTTAGGTFPWQTTPGPLHPLHAALPLSYVVDGLRHLLYGGALSSLGTDVAVLAGYLLAGLALSTLAGRKHRIWTGARLKPELVL